MCLPHTIGRCIGYGKEERDSDAKTAVGLLLYDKFLDSAVEQSATSDPSALGKELSKGQSSETKHATQ